MATTLKRSSHHVSCFEADDAASISGQGRLQATVSLCKEAVRATSQNAWRRRPGEQQKTRWQAPSWRLCWPSRETSEAHERFGGGSLYSKISVRGTRSPFMNRAFLVWPQYQMALIAKTKAATASGNQPPCVNCTAITDSEESNRDIGELRELHCGEDEGRLQS